MSFTVKNYNSATNMSNLYDEIITNSINGFDITNVEEWSKLTADEIKQLQNIDENKISNTAWSYVSGMQDVGPASSPTFYNNHFSEGTGSTNLYFTDARARAAISGGTGIIYDMTTGTISNTIETTSDLPEGTNLYFTTARASSGARASFTGITPISYNASSGAIGLDYNPMNLQVTSYSGVNSLNTIQDISDTSIPTFQGLNCNGTISANVGVLNALTTSGDAYVSGTIQGGKMILHNEGIDMQGTGYINFHESGATGFRYRIVKDTSTGPGDLLFQYKNSPTGAVSNKLVISGNTNKTTVNTDLLIPSLAADYCVRTTLGGKLITSPVYMRDIMWFIGPNMSVGMYDYALNTVASPTFSNMYATGYIGIGTTVPYSQLHIASDSKTDSIINLERKGGKRAMLASALNGVGLGFDASAYLALGSITGPGFTGWNEKARLTADGYLGIGKAPSNGVILDMEQSRANHITSRVRNSSSSSAAYTEIIAANDNSRCALVLNSSTRTSFGGTGCATLINDAGDIRLFAQGEKGIVIKAGTGYIHCTSLTPNTYVKADDNKYLSSTSSIPFSDITSSPILAAARYYPDSYNFAIGSGATGTIDVNGSYYTRFATFTKIDFNVVVHKIAPTGPNTISFDLQLPVNHTAVNDQELVAFSDLKINNVEVNRVAPANNGRLRFTITWSGGTVLFYGYLSVTYPS